MYDGHVNIHVTIVGTFTAWCLLCAEFNGIVSILNPVTEASSCCPFFSLFLGIPVVDPVVGGQLQVFQEKVFQEKVFQLEFQEMVFQEKVFQEKVFQESS